MALALGEKLLPVDMESVLTVLVLLVALPLVPVGNVGKGTCAWTEPAMSTERMAAMSKEVKARILQTTGRADEKVVTEVALMGLNNETVLNVG